MPERQGQRQIQKQQQKLTQQQLFLLELLSEPVDKIEERVKNEVTNNPLIDTSSLDSDNFNDSTLAETGERLRSDEDYEGYEDSDDYRYREYLPTDYSANELPEPQIPDTPSFADELLDQLRFLSLNEQQQAICQEIIGYLDDSGYFTTDLGVVVNGLFIQGIRTTLADVEKMLKVVQSLEPAGVAARNAQECMLLQLRRMPQTTPGVKNAIAIVTRCYDLLKNGNKARIRQQMALDKEEGDQAFALIRHLRLRFGDGGDVAYVSPDFIVTNQDDKLVVKLTRGNMPEINYDKKYLDRLNNLSSSKQPLDSSQKKEKALLAKSKRSADILIETLQQRQQTMLKVMLAIVEVQHDFFVSGNPLDKRPLKQKDIAKSTGFDPTTISRIVKSKYVQTDFGVIGLDKCFTEGYVNDDGEQVAVEVIKELIREIVEKEDLRNPLTDEQIADNLNEQGYSVARRTVVNYRKDLGIAPRHKRRIK